VEWLPRTTTQTHGASGVRRRSRKCPRTRTSIELQGSPTLSRACRAFVLSDKLALVVLSDKLVLVLSSSCFVMLLNFDAFSKADSLSSTWWEQLSD
jgi:hypothetical protein